MDGGVVEIARHFHDAVPWIRECSAVDCGYFGHCEIGIWRGYIPSDFGSESVLERSQFLVDMVETNIQKQLLGM